MTFGCWDLRRSGWKAVHMQAMEVTLVLNISVYAVRRDEREGSVGVFTMPALLIKTVQWINKESNCPLGIRTIELTMPCCNYFYNPRDLIIFGDVELEEF
jgi:hypothetical protein